MAFSQPRDPRWQGPQRWYFRIDLLKNIVLTTFSILVIVETSLHRKWYNAYYNTVEYDSSDSISSFFLRIGMALLPDAVSIIITQTLLNVRGQHPPCSRFHPVYAITQSMIITCLYIPSIFLNWLIAYSEERSMDKLDAWRALCYGEMGLQAVLAVLWGGLTVCSCIAVHKWRHAAKGGIVEGTNKGTVELRDLQAENHSVNADGDREGGSMRKERVFV